MKVVALLFCFLFAVQAKVLTTREADLWNNFKTKHNRAYQSEVENEMRMKIFLENLKTIETHNEKYKQGLATFEMGINEFADMLHSEFVETMLTRPKEIVEQESVKIASLPKDVKAPDSMDWRTLGAVSPVKDQKFCGACWTFSATGALEGHTFLKTGRLVELSQQNLIDCAVHGNNGCHGGLEYNGWEYVKSNGGINTAEAYPYEARKTVCRYDRTPKHIGATCTGVVRLLPHDENELKHAVGTMGPISAGIDAENNFQFYQNGIMSSGYCSGTLNHSILVVGYGTENGQDYWIIKNSYGENYGENGYIRIARNAGNMCGIASDASFPIV